MAGTKQWSDEEILFILDRKVEGMPRRKIHQQYEAVYGRPLSDSSYRYVWTNYGSDPRFFSPKVNLRTINHYNAGILDPVAYAAARDAAASDAAVAEAGTAAAASAEDGVGDQGYNYDEAPEDGIHDLAYQSNKNLENHDAAAPGARFPARDLPGPHQEYVPSADGFNHYQTFPNKACEAPVPFPPELDYQNVHAGQYVGNSYDIPAGQYGGGYHAIQSGDNNNNAYPLRPFDHKAMNFAQPDMDAQAAPMPLPQNAGMNHGTLHLTPNTAWSRIPAFPSHMVPVHGWKMPGGAFEDNQWLHLNETMFDDSVNGSFHQANKDDGQDMDENSENENGEGSAGDSEDVEGEETGETTVEDLTAFYGKVNEPALDRVPQHQQDLQEPLLATFASPSTSQLHGDTLTGWGKRARDEDDSQPSASKHQRTQ